MRHLFIVNPASGKKGSTETILQKIRTELDGKEYEVVETTGPGHAEELARAAAETGEEVRLYACGGDGTLYEVVNGAAGYPNAAVTNVPKGTGNDFLRIFGEGRARFADLNALYDGETATFDLIDCNGRQCIGVMCTGLDARVAEDVVRHKRMGTGAYVLALIKNFFFTKLTRHMFIHMGDEDREVDSTVMCVCNGRYYGGGFMPIGDSEPDDGILDMLMVAKAGRVTFARLVGKYATGRYRELRPLLTDYHGTEPLRFTSEEDLVVVLDGEVLHGKDFTVKLSEKKIRFFYPAGLTYRAPGHEDVPASAVKN